jgi:hypothetical protein
MTEAERIAAGLDGALRTPPATGAASSVWEQFVQAAVRVGRRGLAPALSEQGAHRVAQPVEAPPAIRHCPQCHVQIVPQHLYLDGQPLLGPFCVHCTSPFGQDLYTSAPSIYLTGLENLN